MVNLLGSIFGCVIVQLAFHKYWCQSKAEFFIWFHLIVVGAALADHLANDDEIVKTGLVIWVTACSVFLIILALEKLNELDRRQVALETGKAASEDETASRGS
jgi:hypothetical protein